MTAPDPLWWEKTVEYKFVFEFLTDENIQPLAGSMEESFGDAFLETECGFVLIEYKRDWSSIANENRKYTSKPNKSPWSYTELASEAYEAAGIDNPETSFPHYLVYGDVPINQQTKRFPNLSIYAADYWSPNNRSKISLDKMAVFKGQQSLENYLRFLINKRGGEVESVGGSGGLVTVKSGRTRKWIPISDLLILWKFDLEPSPEPIPPSIPGR